MKKWISLALAFAMALSLTACGSKQTEEEIPTPTAEQIVIPEETETPEVTETPEPVETTQPVETEPVVNFTNPLTGEPTETDISGNRPFAIMLNTLKKSLPQSGNSSADWLVEITEEGGITRIMGVYQDISGIGNLGTVRSTRDYFNEMAIGLDAILVHAGGSNTALAYLANQGYDTLNYLQGKYTSVFWRDSYRKTNVGMEHSLYTSSENIQSYLANNPSFRTAHTDGFTYPYTFAENGTPAGGSSAQTVTVTFSSYKNTVFNYDAASSTYLVSCFDAPYVDENNGAQVAVTNVIVIPTNQTTREDGQHQDFDLSSGTGYFACGGQYIPINWSKGDASSAMTFTKQDGTALELGVGKTYVCICGDSNLPTFE